MCGRYAVSARPERLADQFDVVDIFEGLPEPDYNVAPDGERARRSSSGRSEPAAGTGADQAGRPARYAAGSPR